MSGVAILRAGSFAVSALVLIAGCERAPARIVGSALPEAEIVQVRAQVATAERDRSDRIGTTLLRADFAHVPRTLAVARRLGYVASSGRAGEDFTPLGRRSLPSCGSDCRYVELASDAFDSIRDVEIERDWLGRERARRYTVNVRLQPLQSPFAKALFTAAAVGCRSGDGRFLPLPADRSTIERVVFVTDATFAPTSGQRSSAFMPNCANLR